MTAEPDAHDGPAEPAVPADVAEVARVASAVLEAAGRVVVGQRRALTLTLAAVLAGGHVLLEDVPGLGKTLAARSLASALGLDFRRLQCTPDLLPADVTGSFVYDPAGRDFTFRPGPVFAGLLLVDEVNRTPPKTQSALLEAMQERQVTVEGRRSPCPAPSTCWRPPTPSSTKAPTRCRRPSSTASCCGSTSATPTAPARRRCCAGGSSAGARRPSSRPWSGRSEVLALQAGVEQVDVDPDVAAYCVDVASATRRHPAVEIGSSPRGSLALVLVARALAVVQGRDVVLPEDVKTVAVPALAHRLTLRPETWSSGTTAADVVREVLAGVPTPASAPLATRAGR